MGPPRRLRQAAERVVLREEIIDRIWAGRIISDDALSTCIKAARRAIGDDGKSQRIIRTVHRRGFRVAGPVVVNDRPPRQAAPARSAADSRSMHATADPGADVATDDLKPPSDLSIAVLPFETPSATPGADIIADGLVQDVITRLGRTRQLFVIGRGTVFALRHQASDPRAAARLLGVRYALSGSLQRDGNRLRLYAYLIDADQPHEIWAERFDRDMDDMFAVQDEMSEVIVGWAQMQIEEAERRRALVRPIANLDAWSAYYRACWHLDRHTAGDYDQAESLLERAARLDPGAARIYAGLSFVHRQRAFLNLSDDRDAEVRRALELAEHSLSLEPQDPQAHWAFGRALMLRYEVEAAQQAFEVATSLNPSFAMGQYSVGFAQSMMGEAAPSDDALARSRRLSPIDPMRFAMLATHAFNSAMSGNRGRAVELAQLAAAQPNAHVHIFAVAALCGGLARRPQVAETYLRRLREAQPRYRSADFFRAFPFRSEDHVALFRKGFEALGLPK